MADDAGPVLLAESPVPGHPLGWHRHHDPGNRAFGLETWVDMSRWIRGKRWPTLDGAAGPVGPLNQNRHAPGGRPLGSCTGCASTAMGSVARLARPNQRYDDGAAVAIYKLGTTLDPVAGTYPPTDTGSTTVGVLKAMQRLGLIGSYRWAFDFQTALRAIDQIGPVITGVPWFSCFDTPQPNGGLPYCGTNRGGHEVCLDESWPDGRWKGGGWVGGWQSWGPWGPIGGRFKWSWQTWQALLAQGGEVGMGMPVGA